MPTIIAMSGGKMAFSEKSSPPAAIGVVCVGADIGPCFLLIERQYGASSYEFAGNACTNGDQAPVV